jgi:hypothetical protein
MAKKDNRKKQKKRLKEQKRAATHAKYVAAKAKAERYPEIVFETSEGNGYFVAEVRAVAETLDFDSPEMGPDWMREFYRRYRAEGFKAARFWLEDLEEKTRQRIVRTGIVVNSLDEYPRRDEFLTHLGDRIFERIPIETRRRFLPMNDFFVEPIKGTLLLRFSSLLEEPGEWGTVYYSRLMPKVEISGKRVTVAFSDHAMQQLCARRSPRYLTYGGNADAHAYLAKCIYHEIITLDNGSQVIRLWDCCDHEGFDIFRRYVLGVFGEENRKPYAGFCHYILGYCPFVIENGFAKAKSFLYPGFRGTPERAVLERGGEPGAQYAKWLDESENDKNEPFFETEHSVEVAKWLQDNGVPQVVQMTRTVLQLT